MLAVLPASSLQSLIVGITRHYAKPSGLEDRAALLLSLAKVLPSAVNTIAVAELMADTAQLLLSEAKRYRSCYCNAYREAALMRFLPIILTRKTPTVEMKKIFLSFIPDVASFFVGAALKTIPENDAVCLTPEEIWSSLEEMFTEVLNLMSEGQCLIFNIVNLCWKTKLNQSINQSIN